MRNGFSSEQLVYDIDGKYVFGKRASLTFMNERIAEYAASGEVVVYLMLQCAPFPFECNCVRYC